MKVLVVGGGGREHALAWKLAQSPRVQAVYVAPGNGGTALDGRLVNVNIADTQALIAWAATEKIALTVVGPEQPLAAGMVDEFRQHGLRVFGPTRAAAQLESSKAFSKEFMKRHHIPTADYETFSDAVAASRIRTTRRPAWPSVIGVRPVWMHSTKCWVSTRSASVRLTCGAHMSPLR